MESEINSFLANLEAESGYSESTRLAYANDLRVFSFYLNKFLGRPPLITDFTTQQVAGFINAERSQGRRRSTLIRRLATLKYFSEYLVQQGQLSLINISVKDTNIQQIFADMPESLPQQCLNQQQIQVLLTLMGTSSRPRALRDRAILMLLLETGLSVGDLTALDLTDLDMRAGRFHVTLEGEGNLWLSMGGAKFAMEEYLQDGRPDLLHKPGDPALFISQMNGRLSRQGVWQILNHWGQMAEPTITISPRVLRHTAVLRMGKKGLSEAEIQIRLGHRNPLSTRALIRRLDAACNDKP